jgi:PAS domain S-box-containing protein
MGEQIDQQGDLYNVLLEAQSDLGEGLVVIEDECILYANEAFCKISGYGQQELYSLPSCFNLLIQEEKQLFDERMRRRIADDLVVDHYETAILHKGGRRIDVECAAKALRIGGSTRLVVLARDITERKRDEEKLQRRLEALVALHEAEQVLTSSLELDEIAPMILEVVQRVSGVAAAIIYLSGEQEPLELQYTIGSKSLWRWARSTPEAREARERALERRDHRFGHLPVISSSERGISPPPVVGLYLPLRGKDEPIGLLELYGSKVLEERDTLLLLKSLAAQVASALENAQLYQELVQVNEKLSERESRLGVLVHRILGAQEQQRRHVAYEVHDGLAQLASATHHVLRAFARRNPPSSKEAKEELEQVLELAHRTVKEARRVISDLRPTVLDDFGLSSAIRSEVERLHADGWQVHFEDTLEERRLPESLETTLYRVTQEALTNVRKHAQTTWVRIELEIGEKLYLRVRDFGCGFEVDALQDGSAGGPGERVGFYSMQEQLALVGGELKIHSRPGTGTLITAEVPLPASYQSDEEPYP